MRKKGKTLLLGAAVTGCLFGVYTGLKVYNQKVEEAAQEESRDPVLTMNSDSITELSFIIGDKTEEFEYTDETWKKKDDDTFPVDRSGIENLLEELEYMTAVRTLENVEDTAEYGFDEPQNTITLSDADGNKTVVTIGTTNTGTGDDYVMINDDSSVIYTVSSGVRQAISDDLYDYAVSETIPTVQVSNVDEIEVSRDEGSCRIYRSDDTWCIADEKGEAIHADKDKVNDSISDMIADLDYVDYLEHNCTDGTAYGLDENAERITVVYHMDDTGEGTETDAEEETDADSEGETVSDSEKVLRLTFLIGNCDAYGNYYVQMEGSREVHTMTAETFETFLELSPEEWKETETESGTEESDTESVSDEG